MSQGTRQSRDANSVHSSRIPRPVTVPCKGKGLLKLVFQKGPTRDSGALELCPFYNFLLLFYSFRAADGGVSRGSRQPYIQTEAYTWNGLAKPNLRFDEQTDDQSNGSISKPPLLMNVSTRVLHTTMHIAKALNDDTRAPETHLKRPKSDPYHFLAGQRSKPSSSGSCGSDVSTTWQWHGD